MSLGKTRVTTMKIDVAAVSCGRTVGPQDKVQVASDDGSLI